MVAADGIAHRVAVGDAYTGISIAADEVAFAAAAHTRRSVDPAD